MSLLNQYCIASYYDEFDSSQLLASVQSHIDSSITILSKEFQFTFHTMLNVDPCSYWSRQVYQQTIYLLESLYQSAGSNLQIDENTFNYFIMGYSAYSQISNTIVDLQNFNLALEMKTRLYRLPTYTAILESCLANFLRVMAILTGQGVGKDYSAQSTLGKLVDVVNSNGYSEITKNINVNIRNAINHGKVLFKKEPADHICFYYSEQHVQKCTELPVYEFDRLIDNTYDTASAVLLALIVFMNNHISLLKIDESIGGFVPFSILSMRLSLPGIECQSISDTGNQNQLNTEIKIANTDRSYIAKIAFLLAPIIFEKHNNYDQYLFSFNNPRMLNGWIRFKKQDISDMISGAKKLDTVASEIIGRKEFIIFPESTEEIDMNEIKYFCFPNLSTPSFKVNNVANASTMDRKRLRAHLYISSIDDRNQILSIINQAIEWLLTLKNPPSPTIALKHGDMPADALYINVYRNDARKSKELLSSNDNFVCFVDYNVSGTTTLQNGGLLPVVWNSLAHEKVDKMFIAWRERKHLTRQVEKVGRNDPCPCGSGQKFKKCCGRNQ